ncbi:hypothetical protein [Streptomyces sp. TR02-1]|uniref:hypothetical protein n=1 Tax=Streptomyces sp. TR02-1 TaxID=3385977 RepID=UPI0039A29E27
MLQAPRYGLFSAARVLSDVRGHELGGIEYEAVCTNKVHWYPLPCDAQPPGFDPQKKSERSTTQVVASPFVLYVADNCPSLGRQQDDARRQLRQRLTSGEEAAVEYLLWTGALGTTPSLAGNAEVLTTTPHELEEAVGLLEHWLAASSSYPDGTAPPFPGAPGSLGVLHAPRYLTPKLTSLRVLDTGGPQAEDPLGNRWALGGGYPGTGPAARPADQAVWLYATRPVTVRRSEVIEPADWSTGALDTRTNDTMLLAERMYVLDFPCVAAAVPTTLPRLPRSASTELAAEQDSSRTVSTVNSTDSEDHPA